MTKKLIFLTSILALLLAACQSAASPASQPFPSEGERSSTGFEEAPSEAMGETAADSAGGFSQAAEPVERIVIKNASLEIIVQAPDESMDAIGRMAEEMGGFVVSAELYQQRLNSGVEVPRASITVRVPAERLDEALSRIETQSDLPPENKNINSQDVTQDYTDLQSRLRNLEAAEEQLLKILEDANRTEDVLQVFNQLTSVREQIEVTKGQIQFYDQSARLSSIRVELIPAESVEPLSVAGWQPVGVARDALQFLLNALQFLATAAIWICLGVVPVLAIVLIPLYLIGRAGLRWRARRKATQANASSQPEKP